MNQRQDILKFACNDPLGVELGVAEGVFSSSVLKNYSVKHWYSIDMWAGDRGHDINQYKTAIKTLMPYRDRNTVLKMKFDEALDLFPDEYFDIIYIDGYAHTGQDNGKTLRDWFPKLKTGGIFSGDDYSPEWPKTQEQVDLFCKNNNLELNVYEFKQGGYWGRHPSWYTVKK